MKLFHTVEPVTALTILTLRESGMRGAHEVEVVGQGDKAEVSLYMIRYVDREEQRVLESREACGMEEMLALLNNCRFLSWDGFDGPHPKGVLDGIMFRLSATVNGDRTVRASGSQNFPRHYRDLKDGLYEILNRGEQR